ncbi:alpha-E domain-containing protein [Variovorax sp. HJSM1_2]
MLSRTADHLFWMSRYTERAENSAIGDVSPKYSPARSACGV